MESHTRKTPRVRYAQPTRKPNGKGGTLLAYGLVILIVLVLVGANVDWPTLLVALP